MSLIRMPVFVWTTWSRVLILLSFPVITVALFLLMFDRQFGTVFFDRGTECRRDLVATHLLDLRTSGSLHPDHARDGIISEIIPTFRVNPYLGIR